jgi:hypothetical protein
MKNLKSLLAIVMVLVIGACLTGCVSKADKEASNKEFAKWFSGVSFESSETGSGVGGTLDIKGPAYENIIELLAFKLIIDDTEYLCTDLPNLYRINGRVTGTVSVVFGGFDDVPTTDYDSLIITFKDNNGETVTVTYYPDV